MNGLEWWPFLVPVAGLLAGVGAWWLYRMGREVQAARARESFRLQSERLAELVLKAAAATGKPRGLQWTGCRFHGDGLLVRDRATRRLAVLVPTVVQFEPTPDGDMAEVPAARDPRQATAVLHFRKGEWVSDGRVLFNMTPREAVEKFRREYEPVAAETHA